MKMCSAFGLQFHFHASQTHFQLQLFSCFQEVISDDNDDDEFNIPLSSSVKKTKITQ